MLTTTTRTRSGRGVMRPDRFTPQEIVEDDYDDQEEEYDEGEEEEDDDDEEEEEDDDTSLSGFIVDDDKDVDYSMALDEEDEAGSSGDEEDEATSREPVVTADNFSRVAMGIRRKGVDVSKPMEVIAEMVRKGLILQFLPVPLQLRLLPYYGEELPADLQAAIERSLQGTFLAETVSA